LRLELRERRPARFSAHRASALLRGAGVRDRVVAHRRRRSPPLGCAPGYFFPSTKKISWLPTFFWLSKATKRPLKLTPNCSIALLKPPLNAVLVICAFAFCVSASEPSSITCPGAVWPVGARPLLRRRR